MHRASVLPRRFRRSAAATSAVAMVAATFASLTIAGSAPAGAATLPATYTASSTAKLLHLNASAAGLTLADAQVGLSSADVDSSLASKNSTAESANVNASVLGIALPIDKVDVSAPPTTPSKTRTLLPVNLKPVADVGAINGQAAASYIDATSCVAATNGTAQLSYGRTDVAGVTLLSPNQAVNTVLSTLGIHSLGSVAASWVSSETDLVNRGGGSTISDLVSTTKTSVGDVTLLNDAVKVHVTNPVVLQAKSNGTTGTAGLLNTPTITATIGSATIPIPLNGSPINIALPAPLSGLVGLKITAFQPTNSSSGATGSASLQALLRIQLTVLGVLPTAPLASVDLDVAPMTASATAPTGGIDCKPKAATIVTPANGSVTNNKTPLVSGTAEPGTKITVTEGAKTICTATVDASGNWQCTPTTALADGSHTFTAVSSNAAGVSSDPVSTTFTVDTTAPDAPVITAPTDGSTVTTGTPKISGTAEPNSTVTVKDGTNTVCTATTDATGKWQCTPTTPLSDGAHALIATATDAAGNTSAPSNTVNITVSTVTPPSQVPTSITAPADGSTVNPTPTISGTAAPTSTVTVMDGTNTVCTATTDASGNWQCTPASALADGAHTLVATATGGNSSSAPSNEVHITVTSATPAAPVITAPAAGSSVGTDLPTISGTAPAGSTVTVTEGSTILCTAKADTSGAWSCKPTSPLKDGSHTITATDTDAAGNTSAPSSPVTFTVDTVAPNAPKITSPTNGSTINTGSPTIKGTAEPNSTVVVTDGPTTVCTAKTDASGNWSCKPTKPLGDGSHTITATATDAAGNTSKPSAPVKFTVDTKAPATPKIKTPANGSKVTSTKPKISGTAEPGSTVKVKQGSTIVCTAKTAANGTWSCTPAKAFGKGHHTITATATDVAGNTSGAAKSTFTIVSPTPAPVIKHITNKGGVTGKGVGGDIVKVYNSKGKVVATTKVKPNGTWTATIKPYVCGARYHAIQYSPQGVASKSSTIVLAPRCSSGPVVPGPPDTGARRVI